MLTYNAAAFVEEAIESVLAQVTDFPVELVIGDDNSQDGTPDILRDYAARYPGGIRLHLHTVRGAGNPGLVNFKHNMASLRGRYVATLDGDDYWTDAHKLQTQVDFLETHPAHSSCASDGTAVTPTTSYRRIRGFDEIIGKDITLDFYRATGSTLMLHTSLLYRRDWVHPLPAWYDETMVGDLYINLCLLRRGPCRMLPGRFYAYRVHDEGYMARYMTKPRGLLNVYDDYVNMRRLLPWLDTSELLERRQAKRLRRVLSASAQLREWDVFGAAAWRLVRDLRPIHLRFALGALPRRLSGKPEPRPIDVYLEGQE